MLTALQDDTQPTIEAFGQRQQAVLETALGLLVDGGEKALTTAKIARAANCSKESLYKWFGDRDGLLAAMITFQASKVRMPAGSSGQLTLPVLRTRLIAFARDLLTVLSGDVSIALNRLAIGQAGHDGARLGRLVSQRGRRLVGLRAGMLLSAARDAGLVSYDDADEAFRTLYGLIVRDMHVQLLLGEEAGAADNDFEMVAERAIDQFFRLYRAGNDDTGSGEATPLPAN